MRGLLRFLVGLIGFVAFLGMIGSGVIYAYGAYGAPLIETQLRSFEESIEQDLEDEYPGATVTVEIKEFFYVVEGTNLLIAFEVNAIAEISGLEEENKTIYVSANLLGVVTGEDEVTIYEESEWDDVKDIYKVAPKVIFDGEAAKKAAITGLIICGAVFVAGIIVRRTVLRRKLI